MLTNLDKKSHITFSPEVSVVMPNLNMSKYLPQSIESILNQTFFNFEFLIIDNGSIDNSSEIINYYKNKDTRIKFFEINKLSYSKSLNFLIEKSKSPLIARMDSDDVCLPNRLELQKNYLNKYSEVAVVTSNVNIVDKDNKILKKTFNKEHNKNIFNYNSIVHSSVMFRKILFLNLGGYNQLLEPAEDYDLWIRFLKNSYKIKNIKSILLNYRVHNESVSYKRIKDQYFKTMLIKKIVSQKKKEITLNKFTNFKIYKKYMYANLDYSRIQLAYTYYLFFLGFLRDLKLNYAFVSLFKSFRYDFRNIIKLIYLSFIKMRF